MAAARDPPDKDELEGVSVDVEVTEAEVQLVNDEIEVVIEAEVIEVISRDVDGWRLDCVCVMTLMTLEIGVSLLPTKLLPEQPPLQGSILQQPAKGGLVFAQVYHNAPEGHSRALRRRFMCVSKIEGRTSSSAHPAAPHGSGWSQQPTNKLPEVQAKNCPPKGQ